MPFHVHKHLRKATNMRMLTPEKVVFVNKNTQCQVKEEKHSLSLTKVIKMYAITLSQTKSINQNPYPLGSHIPL